MNKHWLLVYAAGIIEILWVIGLKHSDAWYEWVLTILLLASSFFVLIKAMESLPSATVYAVFTGIGTAGTNVVDTLVFGESFSFLKLFFIALLLAGVIGLKLVTHRPTAETANLPEAEGVS